MSAVESANVPDGLVVAHGYSRTMDGMIGEAVIVGRSQKHRDGAILVGGHVASRETCLFPKGINEAAAMAKSESGVDAPLETIEKAIASTDRWGYCGCVAIPRKARPA